MLHFKTKFDSKDDRGKQELIIAEICSYEKLTKKYISSDVFNWTKYLDCYQSHINE